MESKPTTFKDLIADVGGVTALARAMGLQHNTVKMMQARNSIAIERWPALIAICARRGIILTTDDLISIRAASKAGEKKAAA